MTMTPDPHREREVRDLGLPIPDPVVLSDGVNVTLTMSLSAFDELIGQARGDSDHDDCVDDEIAQLMMADARTDGRETVALGVNHIIEAAEQAGAVTIADLRAFGEACDAAAAIARAERSAQYVAAVLGAHRRDGA